MFLSWLLLTHVLCMNRFEHRHINVRHRPAAALWDAIAEEQRQFSEMNFHRHLEDYPEKQIHWEAHSGRHMGHWFNVLFGNSFDFWPIIIWSVFNFSRVSVMWALQCICRHSTCSHKMTECKNHLLKAEFNGNNLQILSALKAEPHS